LVRSGAPCCWVFPLQWPLANDGSLPPNAQIGVSVVRPAACDPLPGARGPLG